MAATANGVEVMLFSSSSEYLASPQSTAQSFTLIDFSGCESDLAPLLRTILKQHFRTPVYLFNVPPDYSMSDSMKLTISGSFESGRSAEQILSLLSDHDRLLGILDSEGICGHSAQLIEAAQTMEQVAASDATVLIGGESGTGKEMFARTIHSLSARKSKPFIPVNCGAIAEGLIESELFGHEKGSFTGASSMRKGYFEAADGGTLFLDEIGEIKPDVQVRLLRVLEQRSFMRVGGTDQISIDIRLIAASNKDLRLLTDEGRFREDLYYRLSVVSLMTTPLRERPVDIMPLVMKFLADKGRQDLSVDPDAVELLLRYSWPGNVRELRNFVESTLVALHGNRISASAVSQFVGAQTRSNRQLPVATGRTRQDADFQLIYQALLNLAHEVAGLRNVILGRIETEDVRESNAGLSDASKVPSQLVVGSLQEMEREMIERVLSQVGGNRRKAAELLGIGQRTLYRKIKEYDLR
jgi:transcriptional regulator with PAS, ATPase and Fis domain